MLLQLVTQLLLQDFCFLFYELDLISHLIFALVLVELSLPNLIFFLFSVLFSHGLVVALCLFKDQNVAHLSCIVFYTPVDDLLLGSFEVFSLFGFHCALIRHQLILCTLDRDFLVGFPLSDKGFFLFIFAEPALEVFEELTGADFHICDFHGFKPDTPTSYNFVELSYYFVF